MTLAYLCGFAFLAGFVDSIAGGGGLIQIPALYLLLPEVAASRGATLLGTNKLAALCGTSVAMMQYGYHVSFDWKAVVPASVWAFLFSILGARAVSAIPNEILRPLILVLLIAVALYTLINKNLGTHHRPRFDGKLLVALASVMGMVIGFYDGFFGPGTGSFLMFAFIGLFGFNFLAASASSKVVNVATNLSAFLWFAASGQILYDIALPMGLCNIAGSFFGARMAILRGSRFVRVLFLLVALAMIVRFGYDIFAGR